MECVWLLISEPDILHLRLDAVKTKSVGERNEYEHCLAEDLISLVLRHELDGPDIVETVCELDEHDAHVVIEREENALEVLGLHALLYCLVLIVKHCLDLCQTFHESGNLVAEKTSEVIYCIVGVFHHIMQKGSDDGLVSQSDIAYHDLCYRYRVEDVWFTGTSSDALVSFICEVKCLLDHVQFGLIGASLACCLFQVSIFSCNDLVVMLIEL